MMQLDLFDHPRFSETVMSAPSVGAPPSGATIICFPQSRNFGKARHVAALILKRQGRNQESYWRQVCNRMAATMLKSGIGGDEIDRQLDGFHRAVSIQMSLLRDCDRQQPGGAI